MAISKKKKFGVAGGVAALALTGGVAFAYWTSTGEDTDTATTGSENAWTVTINTASISNGTLTPDGPTDNITFTAKNDETGTKRATGAVATVDAVTPNASGPCTAADFAITGTTITTADVAAGGSATGSFNVQLINRNANQDGCKGATVTYKVVVN